MSRICLVTGGAGFIGAAVARQVMERFDRVIVVDCLHSQVHPSRERPPNLPAAIELVVDDIAERQTWDRLLDRARPSVVLHLASETGTGQSLTEATRHAATNVVGLTQMLDAFTRRGCPPEHIVLTSSRSVYGEGAWRRDDGTLYYPGQRSEAMLARGEWRFPGAVPLPFAATETVPHPISVYGATKLAQEHVLQAWSQSFGVPCSILRLQNVYGPGQSLSNPYTGVVTLFARLARAGDTIPLYEDGRMVRDFVYIDDVADAIARCVDRPPAATRLLDIGSGAATTLSEVAEMISARYGAPRPRVTGQYRNGDVRAASCQIAAAAAELGWTPRQPLQCGLEELCSWIDG